MARRLRVAPHVSTRQIGGMHVEARLVALGLSLPQDLPVIISGEVEIAAG